MDDPVSGLRRGEPVCGAGQVGNRPVPDRFVTLLVEDDPADAALLTARLEAPLDVSSPTVRRLLVADTVTEACRVLARHPVDVVLLDLSMHDTGGFEALYRVRAAAPDVPMVVLTDESDETAALAALRAGAQDYVLKPAPDGPTLRRILRYARERQYLLQRLDAAVQVAALAARRWHLLVEVDEELAVAEDIAEGIAAVARRVVPDAAECFMVHLDGKDDVPAVLEVAHAHPGRTADIRARLRDLLARPATETAGAEARTFPTRRYLGLIGAPGGMRVPLRVGGQARGAMVLVAARSRHRTRSDVEFGRSLADRIRLALEQSRAFRQTRRAVAARDRAVGIVSHDLGNLLGTIQICSTALLDDEPPSIGGIRHMAQIIQRSAVWMNQIVQDLLDRASLDAGRLALDRRPTPVRDVIGPAEALFAPLAEEHELTFEVVSGLALPAVDADVRRLLQVISNLLSNAMKFTPRGGRVVLSAVAAEEPAGPGVRFAVRDTGRGIAAEDLAHVFDWFWHSERERKTGTGLGLAIASGLVEAHRRRLHVESAPGEGTTFWFTLPAVADPS
jgi:signal transduction histidine kinase